MTFYFLTEIQTIMDKILGTNLHLWRFFSHYTCSAPHYTKKQKNLHVGSFNYFSYTSQIGSNLYMDTGLRYLEFACFKANST